MLLHRMGTFVARGAQAGVQQQDNPSNRGREGYKISHLRSWASHGAPVSVPGPGARLGADGYVRTGGTKGFIGLLGEKQSAQEWLTLAQHRDQWEASGTRFLNWFSGHNGARS